MTSFGFKAGIGTSSRKFKILGKDYTVGVLVNNNMGNDDGRHRYLRIGDINVAKTLGEYDLPKEEKSTEVHQTSSILVIGTDAPLGPHHLNRLARHAVLGMGRVGLVSYSGSGDFILTFSTANKAPSRTASTLWQPEVIAESLIDGLFEATLEAVEEAYINSLLMAEDMTGRDGHFMRALPIDEILAKLRTK